MGALGLTLLLALALLTPGFAVHFAVYGGRRSLIRSAPPPPNSTAALGVVTLGALAAHATALLAFTADDAAALRLQGGLRLPFDPNPYAVALAAVAAHALSPQALEELLLWTAALSLSAYAAVWLALRSLAVRAWAGPRLLGWADQLQVGRDGATLTIAYVVTDGDLAGAQVGYQGVVLDLGLNAEKAVSSLLLAEATGFALTLRGERLTREVDDRAEPIPQLLIEGARIRNIAFEQIDIPDAELQGPLHAAP